MQDHGLTERGPRSGLCLFTSSALTSILREPIDRLYCFSEILFGSTTNLDGTDYLGTLDPSCEATLPTHACQIRLKFSKSIRVR
ncbi:hypothetical protein NC651_019258 [Populus alba x Populus x berolinensis]|nr:hypothetical protein NC651_019258 [Populus alba x Populus x berolinensis]